MTFAPTHTFLSGTLTLITLFFPLQLHAAADYSVSVREISSSFSENGGTIQLKVRAKRGRVRKRVKNRTPLLRKKARRIVYISLSVPETVSLERLPKRCSLLDDGTRIKCRLGRIRKRRAKGRRITFTTSATCGSDLTFTAQVFRRGLSDGNAENDTRNLRMVADCSGPPEFAGCSSLDDTTGSVTVVSSVSALRTAVSAANSSNDTTILVADGTYTLSQGIQISGSNIVIRSQSGNRGNVILEGQGMTGSTSHIFWLTGDDITIADMTLRRVANHAIQVHGEQDADRPFIHNIHFADIREQFLKGSHGGSNSRSNGGIVQCSRFEFTAGQGVQYYTGGIDVHFGKDWIVRDNLFLNLKSPDSNLAEHAIHFWSDAENTIIERNVIINCDRGIGLGLGERGHSGGTIRNNFIYHDSTAGDVGIGLESAANVAVYHNTIFFENAYPNAIEYRYGSTSANIINNLTNQSIRQRDGASAGLAGNVTNAQSSWFVDPTSGDLHLSAIGVSNAANRGTAPGDAVSGDIDGETRNALTPDAGADESGS